MADHKGKLSAEQEEALKELQDLLEHIETDDMPADMMAVLLNHLPQDVLDAVSDGRKIDWKKLKNHSLG